MFQMEAMGSLLQSPVMAQDSVAEVRGKKLVNPEGFTLSILCWKGLETFFPTHLTEHHLELGSKNYGCFCEHYSRPMRFWNGPI